MLRKQGFRPAMNWLHTWAGICLGTLLFVIFWMGTLSVFDTEIDRWMQPETRIAPTESALDPDDVIAILESARPGRDLSGFLIYLPRERRPYFEVYGEFENAPAFRDRLHPASGESLGPADSKAATGFFYPMHYRLLIGGNLGYWIVAFGTIFMMVLLVTGVVIHRKLFKDFFTFRPRKSIGRSSLDLHNITGTVFLPFHFLICLSGFAIFAGFYASLPFALLKDINPEFRAVELIYSAGDYAYYQRPTAGEKAEMLPLSPLVERAEAIWTKRYSQEAVADRIDAHHYGDRNAYIEVRRHFSSNRAEARRDSINFDGGTGAVLKDFEASPVRQVRTWLEGFHQARFDHWPILWLYFLAGLAGCVMIATGFIYWLRSRQRKGVAERPVHLRLVEAMSTGSTLGLVLATVAYLVANRLLHDYAPDQGLTRESIEVRSFSLVWVLSFVHGVVRGGKAWADQAWLIAAFSLAAAVLNWTSTGDNPVAAAGSRMWSVLGVDLTLLAFAIVAGATALRLRASKPSTLVEKESSARRQVDPAEA